MSLQDQKAYIEAIDEPKKSEIETLHKLILKVFPTKDLWLYNGSKGKMNQNSIMGFGRHIVQYAGGKTGEWFPVGLSANKTGISLYLVGVKGEFEAKKDYGAKLGKASIGGSCIRFKQLSDMHLDVIEQAVKDCIAAHKRNKSLIA